MRTVERSIDESLENPFNPQFYTFEDDFICNDNIPRYMHVDLSIKHDGLGVSMGHVSGWKNVLIREDDGLESEQELPIIQLDFLGKIRPNGGELFISDVRELIINELARRNFNLRLITFDQYASSETIQILSNEGFAVDRLSLDRTTAYVVVDWDKPTKTRRISTKGNYIAAWQALKNALTDGRLRMPHNEDFIEEAEHAERRVKGSKIIIDCQSSILSLDLMESVAGTIFNAVNNESANLTIEDDLINEADKRDAQFYDNIERGYNQNQFDFSELDFDESLYYQGGEPF